MLDWKKKVILCLIRGGNDFKYEFIKNGYYKLGSL